MREGGVSTANLSRAPDWNDFHNSKNACFGRKTKFVRDYEDFTGNRETTEFFGETRDNFGTCGKKSGIEHNFGFGRLVSHGIVQQFI